MGDEEDVVDIFDEMDAALGVGPTTPLSPEEKLYREFVNVAGSAKYEKIHNVHYWLKHELYVALYLRDEGVVALKQDVRSLTKALLTYYFEMHMLPRFESERGAQMGKLADMDKFLELFMAHPVIADRIADPLKKTL